MKATVKVENLKIYAFHGCMEEEKVIGSDYVVDICAVCSVGKKAFGDEIKGTVDYVDLARIAKREMSIRSKLLEAVVNRIISSCFNEISVLEQISVTVSKINPPINADVESVSVSMKNLKQLLQFLMPIWPMTCKALQTPMQRMHMPFLTAQTLYQ